MKHIIVLLHHIRELLEPAEVEMEVFEDYSMVEGEHEGFGLEIGKDYCVEWNGETYVVQAKDFSGITYIGRIPLDFGDTENTSIPFTIIHNYGEETFFVLAYDKTEILSMSLKEVKVKKIPEVFLPSSEDDEQIVYVDFMPANWDTTHELTCRSTILFTDIMGAISSGKTVYARVNKSDLFWAHPELEDFVIIPSFILSLASDVTNPNEVDTMGYFFTGTISKISFELAVTQGNDGAAYGILSFVNISDEAGSLLVVTAALDDNGELRSDYESEEILSHVINGGYAVLMYYGQVLTYYGDDNQGNVTFSRIDSGTNLHPEILYVTIEQNTITYHTENIIKDMIGANDYNGGLNGLVPAPAAGDNNKFLRGDGTWAEVESGSGGDEWELIGEVTLSEDGTSAIEITVDGNGNSFELRKIYCSIFGKGSQDSGVVINIKSTTNTSYLNVYHDHGLVSNSLSTSGKWSGVYIEHIGGLVWHSLFKGTSGSGVSPDNVLNYDTYLRGKYENWQAKPDGNIRGVKVATFAGTFSSGAKFTLWGVRA